MLIFIASDMHIAAGVWLGGYSSLAPTCFSRVSACFLCWHLGCLTLRLCAVILFLTFLQSLFRVEDYWEGYKLFCYSYYSHSVAHEEEFRRCKLGAFF